MKRDDVWMILGVAVMVALLGIVGKNDLDDRTTLLTMSINHDRYIP